MTEREQIEGLRFSLLGLCSLMRKFLASLPNTELLTEKQNRQAMEKAIERAKDIASKT